MKTASEYIKSYLEFAHQVLGVSNIYRLQTLTNTKVLDDEKKKIFNFYFWPEVLPGQVKIWKDFHFDKQVLESSSYRTLFIFFSKNDRFDYILKNQSEMIAKMNLALGTSDKDLLIGWVTPNAEIDFFSVISEQTKPLQIIFFRDKVETKKIIYNSGAHRILETLSPLVDPNDRARKRYIWNDFKRLLAST